MARYRTLGEIIDDVRADSGQSLNPAMGRQIRETIVKLINRHQRRLWDDYTWPQLRVRRFLRLQAGQRYMDPPTDMKIDRVENISLSYGQVWVPLAYGIDYANYSEFNSPEKWRSDPVVSWMISENEQIELWPIPATDGDPPPDPPTYNQYGLMPPNYNNWLMVTGIRDLKPLIAEDDRADLDDQLLTLYVAAELLSRANAPDAGAKLQQASQRLYRLRGNMEKRRNFTLAGGQKYPQFWPRGPMSIPWPR